MKCPVDGSDLQMMERQAIEIDYCPQCRGVWLDRGELDKIIERSSASFGTPGGYVTPEAPEMPRVTGAGGTPTMPVQPDMAPPYPPQSPQAAYAPPPPPYSQPRDYDRDDDHDGGDYRQQYDRDQDPRYGKRKRRSFLDDIFDFG